MALGYNAVFRLIKTLSAWAWQDGWARSESYLPRWQRLGLHLSSPAAFLPYFFPFFFFRFKQHHCEQKLRLQLLAIRITTLWRLEKSPAALWRMALAVNTIKNTAHYFWVTTLPAHSSGAPMEVMQLASCIGKALTVLENSQRKA